MGDILQNLTALSSLEGLNSTKLITLTLSTTILFWKVNKIPFELHSEVGLSQEQCEPKQKNPLSLVLNALYEVLARCVR
jgi:hypothetical protein